MYFVKNRSLFCLVGALLLPMVTMGGHDAAAVRGVRVDPGYFYKDFPGAAPEAAAQALVRDVKDAGVNTIFLYAYNPVYGAYYPTTYAGAAVEPGLGRAGITAAIIKAAKKAGIRVVATFPVNTFKSVWDAHPDWRSKNKDGSDYRPQADLYLLSAWHGSFQDWYADLLQDFVKRHPDIAGLEAHEGAVDFKWDGAADYNPMASVPHQGRYPASELGGSQWKKHRAEVMTTLVASLVRAAHKARKPAYVVQTLTAGEDGSLMAFESVAENSGYDLPGILSMERAARPDYVVGELNWQQWKAEYGSSRFSPGWTEEAAKEFAGRMPDGVKAIMHVELSKFTGASESVEPSVEELTDSLKAASSYGAGLDVYDYHLLKERGALAALKAAYSAH